jgi:hypothetical protein
MPEGARFNVDCWKNGEAVNGNPIWLYGNYNGTPGDVTDYYIDTRWNTLEDLTNQGIPQCGTASPRASTSPEPVVNGHYNRTFAVAWALEHAQDPQAYGAMCTWFVSNALWAGGFPKSDLWTDQGRYRTAHGTVAAWQVQPFLNYIQQHFSTTWKPLGDMSQNAVPEAQLGDIIAYDWGDGHGITHLAFIVDIAPGDYPVVAEMGQFDWGTLDWAASKVGLYPSSPYVKRGWTWSEKDNIWLQKKEHIAGRARAYLLHINGGYITSSF